MRRRSRYVACALVALGLGILAVSSRPSPLAGTPALQAVPTASAAASPHGAHVHASSIVPAAQAQPAAMPDAERLLRQLEPLSLTHKPRALELAMSADLQLAANGVLAEARRALIVTLLAEVDRLPEARTRARDFTRQYPSSPYLPLVQGVTGVHPRPRPSELRDASARLPR